MTTTLTRRPQATAFSIEDLLDRVRRGEVRIPDFQRPLKWTAEDVRDLFDSVYRGYPIGTLLFWRREAPADRIRFGSVRIDAPSHSQALWVVDGQQRITALTGVLLHSSYAEFGSPNDFPLYFDLETEEFTFASNDSAVSAYWLPLSSVLDSELLLEWLDRYPGRTQHPEHTRRAIRLGKAIREYQVPAYVVEAEEEKTLRIIFKRLNTAGKPLTDEEVFTALYGSVTDSQPLNLDSMSASLSALGFGSIDTALLLQAVLAVRGLDITRSFRSQLRDEDDLTESLKQTERALRDAIVFLERDAGIPHFLLLPHKHHLVLLARFFYLHPEPSPRTRALLARFIWRVSLTVDLNSTSVRAASANLSVIGSNEERTVQTLLSKAPKLTSKWLEEASWLRTLDLTLTEGRVAANALLSLQPRHLVTGAILDAGAHLAKGPTAAFIPVLMPPGKTWPPQSPREIASYSGAMFSPANRLFHPALPGQKPLIDVFQSGVPLAPEILHSHGINPGALEALRKGDWYSFRELRRATLQEHAFHFLKARTRYDEPDRPSLQSLIIEDEED